MKILGIIPARGGSKGVPRKNIRLLGGKPLLVHTIQSAAASRLLTACAVSTEDAEIAKCAEDNGAEVIPRPLELAQDKTPTLPVLEYTLLEYEKKHGEHFDAVMILQPTSPFRSAGDIDGSIEAFTGGCCDSLVSVDLVGDMHPARMYTLNSEKRLVPVMPEPPSRRRQDLPAVYHRNGAIYLMARNVLLEEKRISGSFLIPYVMPEERSVNIDCENDLKRAEFMLREGIVKE